MVRTMFKKVAAFALAAVMAVSVLGINPVNVEAASNPTKITLNKKTASIQVGKTTTIKVSSSKPNSSKYRTVTWKTSNKKVATVTSKGVVKGIAPGTATITATSKYNKKVKATCKVTVYKYQYATVKPTKSGTTNLYKFKTSSAQYRFKDGQGNYSYSSNAGIKTFMKLFNTGSTNLFKQWKAKKTITAKLFNYNIKVTGKSTKRTMYIYSPQIMRGKYTVVMYTSSSKYAKGHDYAFAVTGGKTTRSIQWFYVDGSKSSYTIVSPNKQGKNFTYVVRKNGSAAYLKDGSGKIRYKYEKKSGYDYVYIDSTYAAQKGLSASQKVKVTK